MFHSKCFSICSLNIASVHNSAFVVSLIALLTHTLMAVKVSAASIKQQGIKKYPSRELIAQNIGSPTNINYLAFREEILAEINRVRTNPQAYAEWLEDRKKYFEGTLLKLPGEKPLRTNKGKAALEEAIAWLNNLEPLPKLSSSAELVEMAQEQIKNINSHQGSVDLQKKTISYGKYTPEGIVMQLIIDDAHPNRFNRQKILNPNLQSTGIACAAHEQYHNICAIAYADDSTTTTAENSTDQESISSSSQLVNPEPPELVVTTKEESLTEKTEINNQENLSVSPLLTSNQNNNPSLLIEKIHQGKLEEGDKVIPDDGSFYDSYPLEVIAGDSFTISVESEDFDTFLAVMDDKGNILEQNDDISESNSNSRLKVTFSSKGVYSVIVNAYDEGGKGSYLLTVRR